MEKVDLRIIKTKKSLRDALLELISEKEFDKISVTQICDKALVNRMTFYKYYNDKYELLDYCFEYLSDSLVKKVEELPKNENSDPIDIFIEIIKEAYRFSLQYIGPLSSIAAQCNLQIINTLSKVCLTRIKTMFEEIAKKKGYKYPVDLVSIFVFGGFGSLLYHWLVNSKEYPADKVDELLDKFRDVVKSAALLK